MFRRLRSERGSVIVPAIAVMMLLLAAGTTMLATVDTQQRETRRERVRESSFQLAEGILNTQIYQLSKRWPGSGNAVTMEVPYPVQCPSADRPQDCPSQATLQSIFGNVDQGTWGDVTWSTSVRDDSDMTPNNRNFYTDALLSPTVPRVDANGNQRMWVRAEAVVRGRRRVLVALVKAEVLPSQLLPNKTLVAGWFRTTNEGSGQAKDFIDNGETGAVYVRCGADQPLAANAGGTCASWTSDRHGTTIEPERVYSDSDYPNGVKDLAGLEQLRERAESQGNLYPSCPPSLAGDRPGEIVYIVNATGCDFQSNAVFNAANAPGAVVIERGGPLTMRGTMIFYGLIYHANVDDSLLSGQTVMVKLNGNAKIVGGIVVDGYKGGVEIGSSGQGQLIHDPNAAGPLTTFGTAGIVQNSFREITPATPVVAR